MVYRTIGPHCLFHVKVLPHFGGPVADRSRPREYRGGLNDCSADNRSFFIEEKRFAVITEYFCMFFALKQQVDRCFMFMSSLVAGLVHRSGHKLRRLSVSMWIRKTGVTDGRRLSKRYRINFYDAQIHKQPGVAI